MMKKNSAKYEELKYQAQKACDAMYAEKYTVKNSETNLFISIVDYMKNFPGESFTASDIITLFPDATIPWFTQNIRSLIAGHHNISLYLSSWRLFHDTMEFFVTVDPEERTYIISESDSEIRIKKYHVLRYGVRFIEK